MPLHSTESYPQLTDRSELLERLAFVGQVDLAIIGGGATGLGLALDASLRGLSVVLLEAEDFAKGTSSRATKLAHGGVRYLAQGDIGLVKEALQERRHILRNAPHLASEIAFVMPSYTCWQTPFYGLGLKVYDRLAGKYGLQPTQFLNSAQVKQRLPGVQPEALKGGVCYWDGQFNDARLALTLARTAAAQGALLVNYCKVTQLQYHHGRLNGVTISDKETQQEFSLRAKAVVNATGVWVDDIRALDHKANQMPHQPLVSASQGVHVVVDAEFLPGDHALLIPKTRDGRVLFAVPWLGKVVLGTTDTPRSDHPAEPLAYAHEIEFILSEAAQVLARPPRREDVRSVWVGLRPLVTPNRSTAGRTSSISREHTIEVSHSGLVTVTGGKWTTYRVMAEDVLAQMTRHGLLGPLPASQTRSFPLLGAPVEKHARIVDAPGLSAYGSEAAMVQKLAKPGDTDLTPGLSPAMVRYAVRYEYARTVEDVLARRSRLLFLDAAKAAQVASQVDALLREEGIAHTKYDDFMALAKQYQLAST